MSIKSDKTQIYVDLLYFVNKQLSHAMRKCVFGSFRPDKTQTDLLSYRDQLDSRRRTYVTSRDFNDRVHVLFLEILCDSGKTLFDISVNIGQICMRFEADTPQKLLKYAHLSKFPDKKLI